jgi:branched-chain amino acid transport system permease protein
VVDLSTRQRWWLFAAAGVVMLALLPLYAGGYTLSLFIILFANIALATAWSFFSGATGYVSLATAAFFGLGVYVIAILHARIPIPLALLTATAAGFLVALLVGLSTLRLRGVYFVIFSFGLTELMQQVFAWWEITQNHTMSRYISANVSSTIVFEILLAVALLTVLGSWHVSRTRLGQALRCIGADETVARHTGIDTTRVKVLVFAVSASVMALVGAVLALRYRYVDPTVAFNNVWSFQVLIAALLGGPSRPWGPAVGAVPLILLSDYLAGTFPHHFGIALGLCFVMIVYFLAGGIAPLLEHCYDTLRRSGPNIPALVGHAARVTERHLRGIEGRRLLALSLANLMAPLLEGRDRLRASSQTLTASLAGWAARLLGQGRRGWNRSLELVRSLAGHATPLAEQYRRGWHWGVTLIVSLRDRIGQPAKRYRQHIGTKLIPAVKTQALAAKLGVQQERPVKPIGDGALLVVRDLRKTFGGLVAVRDVSFEIPRGGITGLIGPNGSGKTTVLNLITGELRPNAGSLLFKGQEIAGWPSFRICRSRIARTFQLVRVPPVMTTRENVMLGLLFGSEPVSASLAAREADALVDRVGLASNADLNGSQLTYIDQKRVELARALATHPELLLLDEWLAGLNPTELQTGIALIRKINQEGITILMTEHVMEAIRALCDHVVVMNAGEKIAEGTSDAVLSDAKVMEAYLGADNAEAGAH